jgi:hypothetical protein
VYLGIADRQEFERPEALPIPDHARFMLRQFDLQVAVDVA